MPGVFLRAPWFRKRAEATDVARTTDEEYHRTAEATLIGNVEKFVRLLTETRSVRTEHPALEWGASSRLKQQLTAGTVCGS